MNRQQAKELLPIIQALAEGKIIEVKPKLGIEWIKTDNPIFDRFHDYRIKPEPKYRPFKNKEECWQEMLKHQPFGWIKSISNSEYLYSIVEIVDDCCIFVDGPKTSFYSLYKNSTFIDGTPFGIKE